MVYELDVPLVLASSSPRRRELLSLLGIPFEVIKPEIDEVPHPAETPPAFAERVAEEKALWVRQRVGREPLVVAADTIVVLDDAILGKPADADEAAQMLASLSGRSHEVMTGTCLVRHETLVTDVVVTEVQFRELPRAEIEAYVQSGEPMDKAGAYGIQGAACGMVRAIRGSYTNVVGFPLCEITEQLCVEFGGRPGRQSQRSAETGLAGS